MTTAQTTAILNIRTSGLTSKSTKTCAEILGALSAQNTAVFYARICGHRLYLPIGRSSSEPRHQALIQS